MSALPWGIIALSLIGIGVLAMMIRANRSDAVANYQVKEDEKFRDTLRKVRKAELANAILTAADKRKRLREQWKR